MRHRRALVVVIVALVIAVGAITWRWIGEERRLGTVLARLLTHRTGVAITIGGAEAGTGHVTLRDVRLGSHPFDIRVSRLDITGSARSLLASSDGPVEIVATSASVTVAGDGIVPPLDALRGHLLALLDWPGTMRLTMLGGELERDGRRFVVDLSADKTADREVIVTLGVRGPDERAAARVTARATVARAGAVQLAVEAAGEPRRLAGLWPATVPSPTTFGGRGTVMLVKGGDAEASGRLTLGASAAAAVIDGTVRYE